jgi:Copper resistance protein D
MRRFSLVSLVTVVTLAITGSINGYFLVGTIHALAATVYGRLLELKMAIFGAMVAIGAFNLLWLKPRIVVATHCLFFVSPPQFDVPLLLQYLLGHLDPEQRAHVFDLVGNHRDG